MLDPGQVAVRARRHTAALVHFVLGALPARAAASPRAMAPTSESKTVPASSARRGVSAWWRALAIVLALVLLLGWAASASMVEQLKAQIGHLQAKVADLPQVRHIAVLLDGQQQPALLVTSTPATGVLTVQRLNAVREGREDTMQLWALQEGQPPRSLGVITSKYETLQLPLAGALLEQVLGQARTLAISVEDKGGVTEAQGPRLPYLWQGALVAKAL